MSTPEERIKIWRQEQEAKTAEGRRRIWARERQPPQPPRDIAPAGQVPQGIGESFQTGLAGKLLSNVIETGIDLYNAPGETLERAGRAGLEFISAFDPMGNAYEPTVQGQAARVAELNRRADERLPETIRLMQLGQQVQESRPRTTAGRVALGTGKVLGDVAFPFAPESAVGNIAMAPFAGAAVRTAGKVVAPVLQRIRAGRGAATEAAETAVAPEAAPAVREVPPVAGETAPAIGQPIPRPPTAPTNPLQSAYAKLGTDNVDEIADMIANANRRYNEKITVPGGKPRPLTKEERLSSWEDLNRLKTLTPDEHRALGQVLPSRSYTPVGLSKTGEPTRHISDIPASAMDAQLQANLRELDEFFTQEGRAAAPTGRTVTVGDKTYTLTPEQEARWVAEVEEPLANVRRQAKQLRATGRGSDRQRADEIMRGESMRIAATKRQIVGALTAKEEAAIAAREATNYRGKQVLIDGQPGVITGNPFGKVKVRLENGSEITIAPSRVTSASTPAPQIGERIAATARTPTSPVELPAIRAQFPGMPKQQFDDEVLKLAEEGQIALHRHDAPGLLTEAEREGMVKVGNDYYTAATVTGPRVETAALNVGATTAPVKEPLSFGRAAAAAFRTPAQIFRSFRTAFDLSAAANQGAVLSRAHPIQAFRAFVKQLKAIKPSNRKAIDDAIINSPYTKLGRDFDLHIATGGATEEAFMVKQFNKIPGIQASEATYRTYLDTLRLSVWTNYVKALESWGYTAANNPTAYRQAAQFINIATGRGSLKAGSALDKAMTLGGDVLFAPRNLAAKFQLLDPVRYMQLAPGARRLVLKDAATSFGALISTAVLLRAAGVKVGFNPKDDDFLTVRLGNHRYDLTGGLKSEVRFLARMTASIYNKSTGEGNVPAEQLLRIATNYARGKLAPAVGIAYDALKGKDIKGESFSDKSAADIAFQFGPMIAEDMREGYKDSGLVGMAMSTPAFVGQRVSVYPDRAKAAFMDTPAAYRSEQKSAGETRTFLTPRRAQDKTEKDETPEGFAKRLAKANAMLQEFGQKLVESSAYSSATAEQKEAAREHLERVIKVQSHQARPNRGHLTPGAVMASVRASEARERAKNNAARK